MVNRENRNGTWTKCKYLGSMLETNQDIKHRTILAINAMNNLNKIWESKINVDKKMIIFNAFIRSIYTYNSCLWTVTKKLSNKIDATQRKLLRKTLNIKWPTKISNNELRNLTKQEPWSTFIKRQKIRWLGHALRLPRDTPCRQAIDEVNRTTLKPRGHPITTWFSIVKKELTEKGIDINNIETLAENRNKWRTIVNMFK